MYWGSPKHFSTQFHRTLLMFSSASKGQFVSLPCDLLHLYHSVQCLERHKRIRMGVPWYLLQSSNSLILIPTDFWTCQLSGIFTRDEPRYCDKCVTPLGRILSLAELPQACFPLVWNKRIRILYTFLEILLNPILPRCCHLNADCRTSSEEH